jgi:hypothetical protein
MKEISENKVQISACVGKETVNLIRRLSQTQGVNFSKKVDELLKNAAEAEIEAQNHSNGIPEKSAP